MSDARRREHLMHAVHHAQARPQNGNDRNALFGDTVLDSLFQRGLHLDRNELHIVHAHVGHDLCDLFHQFAELLHARVSVTQNGNFMFDERMIKNKHVSEFFHRQASSD